MDLSHVVVDLYYLSFKLLESLLLRSGLGFPLLVGLKELLNQLCLADCLRVAVHALELCGKLVALVLD